MWSNSTTWTCNAIQDIVLSCVVLPKDTLIHPSSNDTARMKEYLNYERGKKKGVNNYGIQMAQQISKKTTLQRKR